MNNYDRNNLNFLLSIDASTLHDWYSSASADDIAYAEELLDAYQRELDAATDELWVEKKLISMSHFHEANSVLSKFQLH